MKLSAFVKLSIKTSLHNWGYDIQRCRTQNARNSLYEPVYPLATYSPWNKDRLFIETYTAIQSHTLVDKYRCFELWSLVGQSKKLDGCLIEIGVWKGGTGALIAKKTSLVGINAPVYLCDTFTGVVKASRKDSGYKGGEHADTTPETVGRLLAALDVSNVKIVEGVFPEGTAHLIEQSKIRLCHIDVDVYQSAKDIIDWIWERMSIGGIVVYDDYGFAGCSGITKYVEEQIDESDRLIVHNLNGHAVVIKIR